MAESISCYSCTQEAQFERLPPREKVAADASWRVAHCIGTTLPGWLVLLPRRHVMAAAELTDAEAADLGGWQVRLSRALHAVTGCEKTYVVAFGEAPGFSHLHFHVVPRPAGLPEERRGPGIFALLRQPAADHVDEAAMNDVALALRRQLGTYGRK